MQFILNILLQIVIFALLPLILFALYYRKHFSLVEFFGFQPFAGDFWPAVAKGLAIALPYATLSLIPLLQGQISGGNDLLPSDGPILVRFIAILLYSFVWTAFTEEFFFRAFMINALDRWIGFWPANIIQAAVFAGLHIFGMVGLSPLWQIGLVGLIFILALGLGQIAHRNGGGSIWAGVVIHGLLNTVASLIVLLI